MKTDTILVPMDFSKCSKNALKAAIKLAHKWNSKIRIVHSTFVPSSHMAVGDAMVQPVLSEYEEYIEDTFEEIESEFPDLEEISYETKEYVSVVTDAIFTEIETQNIDLIIMGTKGTHDMLEKLLGGVSVSVIEFAKVPVLVIPENVEDFTLSRIGMAADFYDIKTESFELVRDLAKLFDAEVQIFNIEKENEKMNFERSTKRSIYEEYFGDLKLSFHHLLDKKASHGIFEYIKSHALDMLVMFPRNHKLFERIFKESETKRVAMKIKIPLLAIHQ